MSVSLTLYKQLLARVKHVLGILHSLARLLIHIVFGADRLRKL